MGRPAERPGAGRSSADEDPPTGVSRRLSRRGSSRSELRRLTEERIGQLGVALATGTAKVWHQTAASEVRIRGSPARHRCVTPRHGLASMQ
jgi:hypothetical protein